MSDFLRALAAEEKTVKASKVDPVLSEKDNPPEKPGFLMPGSKSEAFLRGASNAATLGLGKYIQAPINELVNPGGRGFFQGVKDRIRSEVDANSAAAQANPLTYGAGSLVGAAAPGGLVTKAGTTLGKAAVGGATAGTTTLADTQDLGQAATSATIGAAFPLGAAGVGKVADKMPNPLDWVSSKVGAPGLAVERVAEQTQRLSKDGAAKGLVEKGAFTGTKVKPKQLADEVREQGITVLNQPRWESIKQEISRQNPATAAQLVADTYKQAGLGSAVGAAGAGAFAPPLAPVGGALGFIAGGATGAKDALVRREVQKVLSPAAQRGQEKLTAAMQNGRDIGEGIGHGARFAVITNVLNQTDPEARAAMNEDNPLNSRP